MSLEIKRPFPDFILPTDEGFSGLSQTLPLLFWALKGKAPSRNYIVDPKTKMLIPATWERCMEYANDGEMDEVMG